MPLDFAKTVLQCGSELPIHKVLKQTLQDKGPSGLFTGMVTLFPPRTMHLISGNLSTQPLCPQNARSQYGCQQRSQAHALVADTTYDCVQGPRVTQTAVMSAVFFSLFEFWKSQLKR